MTEEKKCPNCGSPLDEHGCCNKCQLCVPPNEPDVVKIKNVKVRVV